MTVSGLAIQALVPFALRTLEGYWPAPLRGAKRLLTELRSKRLDADAKRWGELALKQHRALGQHAETLTARELEEYANLDLKRRLAPLDPKTRMPTRLGNLLRAMETHSRDHYGLDAIVCWPRLWLILPEQARKEVTDSRKVLDLYAEIWLWSVLFLGWTYFSWWVPLVSVPVAALAYRGMTTAALVYGDLVVACYDLHRFDLYSSLKWPLPVYPANEFVEGAALTKYISRGLAPTSITFTGAVNSSPDATKSLSKQTATSSSAFKVVALIASVAVRLRGFLTTIFDVIRFSQ
ncbi:hypothetical protein A5655_13500 [Mycobacterium sp. 1081908.1]|nr:hypothetical protein A5655_13500 [Mycobacterium sp. 1081908.1]